MNLALFKVIMAQVSVHATMAGMRLAAPLLALHVQRRCLQPQAMLLHGLHMGGPADQRDLVAGARQQRAEIAAHGARAHDGNAKRRGGRGK
jgi:hypothetical protein